MADGKTITIETGKLAKQADGSVVLKTGNTMLLATVVSTKEAKPGTDFLPLSVDYQEKYAAVGRFPGGFFKREARLSEYEILISRLVDRALRPLFPDDYHADVQVLISLISSDKDILPDSFAGMAASAALAVSDIPFNGPISEVRVAKINGKYVINPLRSELENATLDLIVAGSAKDINMVEGEMKEVSEEEMIEAIKLAHDAIKIQCQGQLELAALVEKSKVKRTYSHEEHDLELKEQITKATYDKCYAVAKNGNPNKAERKAAFDAIKAEFTATLTPEDAEAKKAFINKYFHDVEKDAVRDAVLNERTRLDGRKLDEIRPIWSEVDYLPSAHGSAIFTRGETQSLTTVTLGSKQDEQLIDGAVIEGTSNFLLHYNFPSFSTGEVKPNRGVGRREVGHGNLAMRSLKQMLPSAEENPYTVRVVSDILESNGSSSMATVCAGTLALMDAGVKLKKPVSGIAMGLITGKGKYAVLSDILGDEDHLGDMDFKVTGTKDGICGCQMDLKVDGLSYQVLAEALEQAKRGRLHILNEMNKTLDAPRADYKPHAPRVVKMTIAKDFIGAVIGPGGKVIQEMQRETGATISIEEVNGVGIIDILAENKEAIDRVVAKIKGITATPEVGEIYKGKVKSIMPFGAFVEILPGKDGLLHISEIEHRRLEKVEDALKEGQEVEVKLIEVDKKTGKLKLSRKVLLPKPEKAAPENSAQAN
ncbi:MAG: Polyribonucleotide nucleotidyltransferase [Bacteroidia bacterium]|nr:Polyribonucleotide nucleotidyltransferase [Bacteroidia bacterium]